MPMLNPETFTGAQAIEKAEFDALVVRHLCAPLRLAWAAAVYTEVKAGVSVYRLYSAPEHSIPPVEILRDASDPRRILGYLKHDAPARPQADAGPLGFPERSPALAGEPA